LVGISGVACFVTRLFQKLKWLHQWFGRVYFISMLWCCASSLLIHNTGLPIANILQFAVALGGLCIGWILIVFHKSWMEHQACILLQEKGIDSTKSLLEQIQATKQSIANQKSFTSRMVSYKAFHGIVMAISWANLAPRLFASNQSGNFSCYTYPVYKPINTPRYSFANQNLTIVPENSPSYPKVPWANREALWVSGFFVVPLLFSIGIGSTIAS
jgi:hypothetical protein